MLEDYNEFNDGVSKLLSECLLNDAYHDWSKRMTKQEFSDVKFNDKVWDLINGWGKVCCLRHSYFVVDFNGKEVEYHLDGTFYNCDNVSRSLFWDEIKIVAPPKPKKLVPKTFTTYVATDSCGHLGYTGFFAPNTKVKVTIEYEDYE